MLLQQISKLFLSGGRRTGFLRGHDSTHPFDHLLHDLTLHTCSPIHYTLHSHRLLKFQMELEHEVFLAREYLLQLRSPMVLSRISICSIIAALLGV